MDQMLRKYTTQRRTSRWPFAFFYNILDIAALAAYIIYYENNKMAPKKTNQRRLFLRQLSQELCRPIIEDRSRNAQITRHFATRNAIESVIGQPLAPPTVASTSQHQPQALDNSGRKIVVGSCYICYKGEFRKRRKTRKSCSECNKPVCDELSKSICICLECFNVQ